MCNFSSSQIKADGVILANALNQLAARPGLDPTVADDLKAAATGVLAVTSDWTTGTPQADFDAAMRIVTEAMALIPEIAPYADFVAIIQMAIDLLWANVGNPPVPVTLSTVKDTVSSYEAIVEEYPSHWHGKAKIVRHHFESWHDAIARTWDEQVAEHPELGFSKL